MLVEDLHAALGEEENPPQIPFPPEEIRVGAFEGEGPSEYKVYMAARALREEWENARLRFRIKEAEQDKKGMAEIARATEITLDHLRATLRSLEADAGKKIEEITSDSHNQGSSGLICLQLEYHHDLTFVLVLGSARTPRRVAVPRSKQLCASEDLSSSSDLHETGSQATSSRPTSFEIMDSSRDVPADDDLSLPSNVSNRAKVELSSTNGTSRQRKVSQELLRSPRSAIVLGSSRASVSSTRGSENRTEDVRQSTVEVEISLPTSATLAEDLPTPATADDLTLPSEQSVLHPLIILNYAHHCSFP